MNFCRYTLANFFLSIKETNYRFHGPAIKSAHVLWELCQLLVWRRGGGGGGHIYVIFLRHCFSVASMGFAASAWQFVFSGGFLPSPSSLSPLLCQCDSSFCAVCRGGLMAGLCQSWGHYKQYAVPENVHSPPTEGFFFHPPPLPRKFRFILIHCF